MVTSKDCIHYKVCAYCINCENCPFFKSSADVVPSVEFKAMRAAANSYKMHYEGAKSEAAREIFEEIEDILNNIGYFDEIDFKALKKKYLPDITAAEAIANFHEAAHEYGDFLRKLDAEKKAKTEGAWEAFAASHTDGNKVSSGDICVVCGEHVPEGRQICTMCEIGQELLKKRKG